MKLRSATALAALLALAGCGSGDGGGNAVAPEAGASTEPAAPRAPRGPERRIMAFGDSLFAGYGLKPGESYPAKLEAALRARGINARIANASVSGDTTADGLQRLAFALDNQPAPPELVLISLGGNDMLRGLSTDQTRANLDAILTELDRRKIRAMLMGMLATPNMGKDYARQFNPVYPTLARKHDAALVPFLLRAVIDKPDLKQADHIHPTAAGVDAIVAATVADVANALPKTPPDQSL